MFFELYWFNTLPNAVFTLDWTQMEIEKTKVFCWFWVKKSVRKKTRNNWEFRQQWRRRLQIRKFALPQLCLELNSKGLYRSSGKEKKTCCLTFTSSTNREIRHFHRHVVVVQRRKRNVQKRVLHVQGCYLPKPIAFLPFSLTSLLKLPNKTQSRRYVLFWRS